MIFSQPHAHPEYDRLLQGLINDVYAMSRTVDQLLEMLVQAVKGEDVSAKEAKMVDKEVNQLEQKVTTELHSMLTKYSPPLNELRFLIAMVQVASRLERVGDVAKTNIRRLDNTLDSNEILPEFLQKSAVEMIAVCRDMLAAANRNISQFDEARLSRILEREDGVNQLYVDTLDGLQEKLPREIRKNTSKFNALLMLFKDIERCADQGFEIGRIAYYAHTGDRPKKKEIRKA